MQLASEPVLDDAPPFEQPCITLALRNFIVYKYGHLATRDMDLFIEMAKLLMHCLNHWRLPKPSERNQASSSHPAHNSHGSSESSGYHMLPGGAVPRVESSSDDILNYKVIYSRWLSQSFLPTFCDSFTRYEVCSVFGRKFLQVSSLSGNVMVQTDFPR